MAITSKILLTAAVLFSASLSAIADKGAGKKAKNKVVLNIKSTPSLRSNLSFSLKNGLRYSGSQNNLMNNTRINTYKKGNTVYILPSKPTVLIPEVKQGYTGLKLIITKKN